MPRLNHLIHPGRDGKVFHFRQRLPEPNGIPGFERPYFPAEARAHRIVYLVEFVRNLRYAMRYITEERIERLAIEFACFVFAGQQHLEALPYFDDWLCGFKRSERRLGLRLIFKTRSEERRVGKASRCC